MQGDTGFPDLVLVRQRILFAELKSDDGRLTFKQKLWRAALEAAGAAYYCWRPKDWTSIEENLR